MKKKICFVASAKYPVTAFLINHIRQLSKHYDVSLIVNTDDVNFLAHAGINIKVFPVSISRNIDLINDLKSFIAIFFIIRRNKFSAVHSLTPKAGFLAMMAAFINLTPLKIHTFTGQIWAPLFGIKRKFLKLFDKFTVFFSDHNIVDSQSQLDYLLLENILDKNNSYVFGNGSISGVDLNRFKFNKSLRIKTRKELSIPDNAFVFIFLGRLKLDKGVIDLAKAFSKLSNINCFLLFVGPDEGAMRTKIRFICKDKIDFLRFVDFTNYPENYLNASDTLNLPSYREGFGSVIIEAASVGIPSIGSNIYGISDAIVDRKSGFLHNPGDIYQMSQYMKTLSSSHLTASKMGTFAKQRVNDKFDANFITKLWLNFYAKYL